MKTAKKGEKEKLTLNFKPLNIMSSTRKGRGKLDIDDNELQPNALMDSVNTQRAPEDMHL